MKLFTTAKTGFFLDSITHKTEKRRDGETKVIVLGCRIVPFDHKLAQSMDDLVRGSLFKRSGNADRFGHIAGMDFALGIERQDIDIYASPDTEKARLRLEQVKVSGLRAQVEKGSNMYALKVKLTFGPASKNELEFVESWRQTQSFLTFFESQPDLAYEEIGGGEEDDDVEAQPALEMDPEESLVTAGAAVTDRQQHKAITHRKKSKKR